MSLPKFKFGKSRSKSCTDVFAKDKTLEQLDQHGRISLPTYTDIDIDEVPAIPFSISRKYGRHLIVESVTSGECIEPLLAEGVVPPDPYV